jgi:hypothetical protein
VQGNWVLCNYEKKGGVMVMTMAMAMAMGWGKRRICDIMEGIRVV